MMTAANNEAKAVYFTAAQLSARGRAAIPDALISHTRLIYNSKRAERNHLCTKTVGTEIGCP